MDRRNPTPKSPLNPLAVVMLMATFVDQSHFLHEHGDAETLRQFAGDFFADIKRQYDRKLMWQAFRLRSRWRKSDVPRLLRIFDENMPATRRSIERLAKTKEKAFGRGVIPEPVSFEQAFFDGWRHMQCVVDPTTTAEERRDLHQAMPKHAHLIKAAYRGELALARRRMPRGQPHRKASEIAEEAVAEAAGISPAMVHELCQQVREEERKRSGVTEPEPTMTARDLKKHLDRPAELAKKHSQGF
jgi:hypothetical protein